MSEFFDKLRNKEEYANISCTLPVFHLIKDAARDQDFQLNYIKQKNESHNTDDKLGELYKQRAKINKEILKREFEINHGKVQKDSIK